MREAGRIVVCVEASAEVRTARTTTLSSGEPRTSVAMVEKIASSLANPSTVPRPVKATTEVPTEM